MSFGLPERNGLSVGVGSWATLSAGVGAGGRNRRSEPTLIMDFVLNDPTYDSTLNLDFTTQAYTAYASDNTTTPYRVILEAWT